MKDFISILSEISLNYFFFTFQISTRFNFLSILSVNLKGNGVYNEETCGRSKSV